MRYRGCACVGMLATHSPLGLLTAWAENGVPSTGVQGYDLFVVEPKMYRCTDVKLTPQWTATCMNLSMYQC